MAEGTAEEYDDRTIGRRLKRIRQSRRKSLRAVAELAGISAGHLSRIENGERALDRRSVIVALANVLQVSPSELTSLPVPAPADGTSDSSIYAVRRALMAVSTDRPGGQVQPVEQLRHRANHVETVSYDQRGLELPGLITDLHSTIAERKDTAELLRLAVMLHAQTVRGWLLVVGAPLDLRWQASMFARRAAEELGDSTLLGVVAWGTTVEMLTSGAFDLARGELDATTVPTDTAEGLELNGMLSLSRSLVAAADNRTAEREAALEHAAALESDEPDIAVGIAEGLRPAEHPSRERQATYFMDYGRALARVRRRDDAVRALRQGETIFPMRVLRNPFVRDTLAELRAHARRDAVGRELAGMAYRAGLPA